MIKALRYFESSVTAYQSKQLNIPEVNIAVRSSDLSNLMFFPALINRI